MVLDNLLLSFLRQGRSLTKIISTRVSKIIFTAACKTETGFITNK